MIKFLVLILSFIVNTLVKRRTKEEIAKHDKDQFVA